MIELEHSQDPKVSFYYQKNGKRCSASISKSLEVLRSLGGEGAVFWKGERLILDLFAPLSFSYSVDKKTHVVEGVCQKGKTRFLLSESAAIFYGTPPFLIHPPFLYLLSDTIDWKWYMRVFPKPWADWHAFLGEFQSREIEFAPEIEWNGSLSIPDPLPVLQLLDQVGCMAHLQFDYGDSPLRNPESEMEWERDLLETDYQIKGSEYYAPSLKVFESLTFLLELGWKVRDFQGNMVKKQDRLELSLDQNFALKGSVFFGEISASFSDFLPIARKSDSFFRISDFEVGLIDRREVPDALLVDQEIVISSGKVCLRKEDMGILEGISGVQESLDRHVTFDLVEVGKGFVGTLYPHQRVGMSFLSHLLENNWHGLLADDMGLGKSVQVIALLSRMRDFEKVLIVAPRSLSFHWKNECRKFLPEMSVCEHLGERRKENTLNEKRVIITSYATLLRDVDLMKEFTFDLIVLDEAQVIKNSASQTFAAVCALTGKMRLCLSGTPMENSAEDLWSLFHFLMPTLLGDLRSFRSHYSLLDGGRNLFHLRKKIAPFMLRRMKKEILPDLPEKVEQTIFVEMCESQRAVYEKWLGNYRAGLIQKIARDGAGSHRMEVLEAILRLRQIACHPLLVDPNAGDDSGKLDMLLLDLEQVVERKEKAIVYSQFTGLLTLIKRSLREKNIPTLTLDGKTKNREEVVNLFQTDVEYPVFLVSLKAGGVGLTLTAADYVFLFDPWWNEAVENQAIDRAHRIGRKKKVIARRYITADSIEEKVLELKEKKSFSIGQFLEGDEDCKAPSLDDLLQLFKDPY